MTWAARRPDGPHHAPTGCVGPFSGPPPGLAHGTARPRWPGGARPVDVGPGNPVSGPVDFDDLDLEWLRSKPGAKWHHYGRESLAAWVADMDFPPPPPVTAALHHLVDGGDLGYPDWLDGSPLRRLFASPHGRPLRLAGRRRARSRGGQRRPRCAAGPASGHTARVFHRAPHALLPTLPRDLVVDAPADPVHRRPSAHRADGPSTTTVSRPPSAPSPGAVAC